MSDDLTLNAAGQTVDLGLIGDHRNLKKLREMGLGDKKSQALALKAAAEQFEQILNKFWVDAMRQSNDSINPDSPLHSKYSSFYDDMLTQQQISAMTSRGGMNKNSMTYMITKQFAKSLGDEGKELMKELDKMTVSSHGSSYIAGSNISNVNNQTLSVNRDVDNRVNALDSIYNYKKVYESMPDEQSISNITSDEDFVEKMMPYALKAVEGLGFNPLVLVAQAALETGWGKHVSSGNNFYGIKANSSWGGESENLASDEFVDGKFVKEVSSFRKYSGVLESMQDYIRFIKENPRYQNAVDKSFNPDEYFKEIQNAGYATDPNYADKLIKISRKIAFMAYK